MEKWREVPGSEGMYKIEKGTWRCWSEYKHRFLSKKPKRDGRLYWNLHINGKSICRQAAVWIALTFPELVQGEYFEGAQIDHIDTNPANNSPENLRWCTRKENCNNPLTKIHISEAQKGRRHTEETRRKMSEALKGRRLTEEHRRKLSEVRKGKLINHPDISKPVNQYDLEWNYIAWYPSAMEAERQTGVDHRNISAACRGERKTPGGFRWSYA